MPTSSLTDLVARAVLESMEAAQVSQMDVSDGTGIPQATLSRRLRGLTPFDIAELEKVAAFLDLPPSCFINEGEAVA